MAANSSLLPSTIFLDRRAVAGASGLVRSDDRRRLLWAIGALCAITMLSSGDARADQIVVGDANHTDVQITGVDGGEVTYRTSDGVVHAVSLNDVRLIFIDQIRTLGDFNEAERFLLDGKVEEAIVRYQRARRLAESFWKGLVAARLINAYDRAERIDDAVDQWIVVLGDAALGSLTAARLLPNRLPSRRTAAAGRSVEALAAALADLPDSDRRTLLELLRFDIMNQSGDSRAASVAPGVAVLAIAKPLRCERLYRIQLAAFESLLGEASVDPASLDRAILACPRSLVPSFLLLKGDRLLKAAETRDDLIRASWPYMHIVAMVPTDERAADGLFRTAGIVERIGRSDTAAKLLRKCLEHPRVSDRTRHRAKAALKRVEAASRAAG